MGTDTENINVRISNKKKWIVLLVLFHVIMFSSFFVWHKYFAYEFVPYEDFNEFLETARGEKDVERYVEGLKEAYTNDTYGGETPEETFNMFIEALKAGDTDLAAKYFLVEKQARMAEEFAIGKENGSLTTFIGYLEQAKRGEKKISGDYESIQFTYAENGVARMSFNLIKNPYSGVWKMESL